MIRVNPPIKVKDSLIKVKDPYTVRYRTAQYYLLIVLRQ